ncbi:hypothetical protein NL676_036858 [Syzygium grande]|nr:hypothetical protein NL676_036858 [Syzygium grande]
MNEERYEGEENATWFQCVVTDLDRLVLLLSDDEPARPHWQGARSLDPVRWVSDTWRLEIAPSSWVVSWHLTLSWSSSRQANVDWIRDPSQASRGM